MAESSDDEKENSESNQSAYSYRSAEGTSTRKDINIVRKISFYYSSIYSYLSNLRKPVPLFSLLRAAMVALSR